jgi:DNA adenine methylase
LTVLRRISRDEAMQADLEPASPIVKWAGGKRSLRQQLLQLTPPQVSVYYEPFLGGASFFLSLASLAPIARAVLNDVNDDLMQLYRAVRDDPAALMVALNALQPHVLDEAFYYELRGLDPDTCDPDARAARFVYLNKTCYNGLYRVNRKGRFNVPFGRYATPPALYNRDNLLRVSQLLRLAELRCEDFAETLKEAGTGDFVYLDPPYVPLNQTASFTRYTRLDFGADDQRRLAQVIHELTARGCNVLLSNSETPLVRELYRGPRYQIDVVLAPRNINSDGGSRQKVPELAIRNYSVTRGVGCHARATDGAEVGRRVDGTGKSAGRKPRAQRSH